MYGQEFSHDEHLDDDDNYTKVLRFRVGGCNTKDSVPE